MTLDVNAPVATRPSMIRRFEVLWAVSLTFSALQVALVTIHPTRFHYGPLYLFLLTAPLMGGLVLWISRGRSNLAKWILTAPFVLGLPGYLLTLLSDGMIGSKPLSVLITFIQLTAIVLLFTPSARAWLGKPRRDKPAP